MPVTRRTVLKGMAAAAATTVAGVPKALARERKRPPADAVGMLYDATRCIGCKACVVKCKEANNLPPEPGPMPGKLYDAPVDLSGSTKNVIKLYREGDKISYMKAQCMHCVDPACASVCMISAFKKGKYGIVEYDPDKCVGCRYCQVACPFNVPRYEWNTPFPKIVKCEMCRHRLAEGKLPACVEVCPKHAVIFGKLEELKADARGRLAAEPGRYYPKVYGETDGGGTQVLYLSAAGIPFGKLGLPDLGDQPVPELSESLQHAVYQGFIAPAVLYGALGLVIYRNRKHPSGEEEGEE
ncbi:MAG TPA: hydrogenase 2 operon protein HybA [Candidatus Limnocylindrales bacterium]|nr:hydrogenase 2 operon protein HybA [Candidatus Limnocylindrales bacterium]